MLKFLQAAVVALALLLPGGASAQNVYGMSVDEAIAAQPNFTYTPLTQAGFQAMLGVIKEFNLSSAPGLPTATGAIMVSGTGPRAMVWFINDKRIIVDILAGPRVDMEQRLDAAK